MIHLHKQTYEYLEEINEGIIKQLPVNMSQSKPYVLDVGCGSGALSEAAQQKGYLVWGIEENELAAAKAAERIVKVIRADLTQLADIKREISGRQFDYIIFSDVLEHVYDPFTILKEYLHFMKPGGNVLLSVPNVATWTNRIKMLFGKFSYTDTGIMDRTHIRFFTFKTAKELVKAAGCSVVKIDYTPYLIRAALPIIKRILRRGKNPQDTDRRQLIDLPLYKTYMRYFYPIEYCAGYFFKPLLAFRIIIIGRKLSL